MLVFELDLHPVFVLHWSAYRVFWLNVYPAFGDVTLQGRPLKVTGETPVCILRIGFLMRLLALDILDYFPATQSARVRQTLPVWIHAALNNFESCQVEELITLRIFHIFTQHSCRLMFPSSADAGVSDELSCTKLCCFGNPWEIARAS